jgi:hypothetical protein
MADIEAFLKDAIRRAPAEFDRREDGGYSRKKRKVRVWMQVDSSGISLKFLERKPDSLREPMNYDLREIE